MKDEIQDEIWKKMAKIMSIQRTDEKLEKLVNTVRGKFIKKMEDHWKDYLGQHSKIYDVPFFSYWNGKGTAVLPKELYSEQEFNEFVNLLKAQIQKDCPGDYEVSMPLSSREWRSNVPSWYPADSYAVNILNRHWPSIQAELDRLRQEYNNRGEEIKQARKAKADQRRDAENQARAEGRIVLRDLLKLLRNSEYNKRAKIFDYFGDSKGYKSLPLYYSDTGKLCFPESYYDEEEVDGAIQFLNANGKGEFEAYIEEENAYIAGLHTYGWIGYIKKVQK